MSSVMWFRRDLRVTDHPALCAAAAQGAVTPLFVVDPAFARAGMARQAALTSALNGLQNSLGGSLVIRSGSPETVVPAVAAEVGASAVYVSRDATPYGRRRDQALRAVLEAADVHFVGVGSHYAVPCGTVTRADGKPYSVFTPFSKAWRAAGWSAPLPAPSVDWRGAGDVSSEPLAAPASLVDEWPIDERAALDRWRTFADGALVDYGEQRNLPGVDGTSRLSAALRFGTVHARQLLAEVDHEQRHRSFANELAWREFYADVLFRQPHTAWINLNPSMAAMPVDTGARAEEAFRRWCDGTTGYPIVDAGMRQLRSIGWMHNRVRMIVASFLVKDLHLPWQWGARHFMRYLVDGDLASNSHGWQWIAGTGTDAAPYFRVFNPTGQGERFDPEGVYVRTWVPELRSIESSAVHAPTRRPDGYPPPMVDHAVERVEALARYQSIRPVNNAGSR
jgi:deoxyribodipyrimidine photo-lyase